MRQKILAGIGIALGMMVLVFTIATQVPTFVGGLSAEFPPIDDKTLRKPPSGPGPGLNHPATEVREEEVTFPSSIPQKGIDQLKGTLSLPALPGPRPAVILVHGSGPSSRNAELPGDLVTRVRPPFQLLRELADFFAHEGLVVLRWDKRAPQFYPGLAPKLKEFRFADYETDARDAIAYLATRPEVNANAIVVAGHSEGGGIAPHVAAGNARVAAVVMLAAFPDPFDAGAWQLRNHARTRMRQLDILGSFTLKGMADHADKCIAKLETDFKPDEVCIPGASQLVIKEMVEYGRQTMDKLRAVDKPIFAVQGSVDRNIDPETIPRLRRELAGRDIELHYVPKLNHLLMNVIDKVEPTPRVDDEIKRRLRAFLTSVRAPQAP